MTASKLDPESSQQGGLTTYLLDKLTIEEILFLYDQYLEGTKRLNPKLTEMKTEELKTLVDDLKKNQIQTTDLSLWQLQNLVGHLVPKGD